MFSLTDTHIHLDAPELMGQGLNFIPAAQQCGINRFIVPGVRVCGWEGMVSPAKSSAEVYLAPGLHPACADQWTPESAQWLGELTNHRQVVAIGEIGLDGTVEVELENQLLTLRAQLQIALEAGLPVLLHARKSTGKLLAILRELKIGEKIGGIWHGFSGSLPVAQELVDLGFKIGVGPTLLRKNAQKLPAVVKLLPATTLVLETDLPDMADKPEVLLMVAEKVAELRGLSLEKVAQITTENSNQLFRF